MLKERSIGRRKPSRFFNKKCLDICSKLPEKKFLAHVQTSLAHVKYLVNGAQEYKQSSQEFRKALETSLESLSSDKEIFCRLTIAVIEGSKQFEKHKAKQDFKKFTFR